MVFWWGQNGLKTISALGLSLWLSLSALPGQADDYRVKYTYDSSTNKVLTNVGQNATIPDAASTKVTGQSTYMKKIKERQQAALQRKKAEAEALGGQTTLSPSATNAGGGSSSAASSATASKSTTASRSSSSAPSGRTVVSYSSGNIKIHTIDDGALPPPSIEYGYSGYGSRSSDSWAFSTFDASKRRPRVVRYFGWHRDESGRESNGWYNVDLNPLILSASKAAGVDPLLVEIIMCHESGFNPYARSPVGAVGLMQLMPDTAGGLGVSDVFNVRDNIRGGAQYIAYQLARFNSVPLALAAYNAGPGAVLQYGGVPPYSETQNYVSSIYGEYKAALRYRNAHR